MKRRITITCACILLAGQAFGQETWPVKKLRLFTGVPATGAHSSELPDPCSVLDADAAAGLLAAPSATRRPPAAGEVEAGSTCRYVSDADDKATASLTFTLNDVEAASSGQANKTDLRSRAVTLGAPAKGELIEVDGIGNLAYAIVGRNAVALVVFTGIDAAAPDGQPGAREVIGIYRVADSAQPVPELMKNVYRVGRQQITGLQRRME